MSGDRVRRLLKERILERSFGVDRESLIARGKRGRQGCLRSETLRSETLRSEMLRSGMPALRISDHSPETLLAGFRKRFL